jgi:hypothetical protein
MLCFMAKMFAVVSSLSGRLCREAWGSHLFSLAFYPAEQNENLSPYILLPGENIFLVQSAIHP